MRGSMKIKICGIRREEDVLFLNESLPDFAGFIFADTRRKVTKGQALRLRQLLDRRIRVFGVFVNAPVEEVCACVHNGSIDAIQLHGDETEEYIQEIRHRVPAPVIKAVRVREASDILEADRLSCDYLLLDTYSAVQYGGTGKVFSWDIIPEGLTHPYFLAGGLCEENIREAMKCPHCYGLDVSGGVETGGVKDREKINKIIEIVRSGGK